MTTPTYTNVDELPIVLVDDSSGLDSSCHFAAMEEGHLLRVAPHPKTRKWYNETGG